MAAKKVIKKRKMGTPYYAGFFFSYKKFPEFSNDWITCKEDAGRLIARYAKTSFLVCFTGRDLRKKKKRLQARLRKVSAELGVKEEITVLSINGQSEIIRVSAPKEWLRHRVAAHLYLTYIRRNLRGMSGSYDTYHLQNAAKLIRYAKKIGLKKFNTHMKRFTGYPRMRGIVEAENRLCWHSRVKLYKEA